MMKVERFGVLIDEQGRLAEHWSREETFLFERSQIRGL